MELGDVATTTTPAVRRPERFNAAHDLLERNLRAARADKIAYIDDAGSYTYADLASRVDRFARSLYGFGVDMEQRILLCLRDGIDFPTAFLGAIKAGVVPVPVDTLLAAADYAYLLRDSRARMLVVSAPLLPQFQAILAQSPFLKHVLVSGTAAPPPGTRPFHETLAGPAGAFEPAPTSRDEPCFWLYSSGSTGAPKGTVHVHSSLAETAALYAQATLGLHDQDILLSGAKLCSAYGLGNALTFPLAVGATAVLVAERATSASIGARLRRHRPTILSGAPAMFAALLAGDELPAMGESPLRLCNSAGESLPVDLARRWRRRTGIDIVEGLCSTEMLHIFISNRPDRIQYGTLGVPVPGYDAKIVDDGGNSVVAGETGHLLVRGSTSAKFYWDQHARSRATFEGAWTRTGDRVRVDKNGDYLYAGRAEDSLNVGGIVVSPIEIESAILAHPAVHEVAVVGREGADHLVKPVAYVVLAPGFTASDRLAGELKAFGKSRLVPNKYPRRIEFVAELPKSAVGNIQRFKLRAAGS